MSEWRECTLGDLVNLQRGHDLPAQKRVSGSVPIIGSFGITGWHNEAKTKGPGVTLGRSGASFGAVSYCQIDYWPLNTALYVKDFLGNDERFTYYFLKSIDFDGFNSGSAQASLNRNFIHPLPISLPPLPEQKAIASVLSSLDDKIDLLHRQNQTLEAIAETLFRQWFVEEAQEEWEEGVLLDEFDFTMGQSPPGSSFNQECAGMPMFQGNADFGFRFPEERVYTTEPKRLAYPNDTLISVRAPVGAQNMAQKECCIGRGVAAFRYRYNNNFYTYTYFKLRSLVGEIKKFNDEGTVFGSIGKTDFQELETFLAPKDVIEKFENEAKPLNDKIIENCNQIRTLEKLRDSILPKLMSGEVRTIL